MQSALIKPSLQHLPAYVDALERGWSPDNLRPEKREEELKEIKDDPQAFLVKSDDSKGGGDSVILHDGSKVPRLPGLKRWIWDSEFCGDIGFRYQPGTPGTTTNLPRPYRLFCRAMETKAWLCHASA